ncbi:coilin-like [Periplaneta americana]|uniref:coilin-like n=1 Tax=Periplaneta americana TaxID=6978 RepID=UPI0037E8B765
MADMLGFRVGVDGSEIRNGIRNKFFIYVNLLHDRKIQDVENRIRSFLRIDKPVSLLIGKFYLPSEENVRLLSNGDILKVLEQSGEESYDEIPVSEEQNNMLQEIYVHKRKKRKKNTSCEEGNIASQIEHFGSETCLSEGKFAKGWEESDKKKKSHTSKKNRQKLGDNDIELNDTNCENINPVEHTEEKKNSQEKLNSEKKLRLHDSCDVDNVFLNNVAHHEVNNSEDSNLNKSTHFTMKYRKKENENKCDEVRFPDQHTNKANQMELSDNYDYSIEEKHKRSKSFEKNVEFGNVDDFSTPKTVKRAKELNTEILHDTVSEVVGTCKEAVENSFGLLLNESGTRTCKKRIRRRKKKPKLQLSNMKENISSLVVNEKAESPRTHIRFSNSDVEDYNPNIKVENQRAFCDNRPECVMSSETTYAGLDSEISPIVQKVGQSTTEYATKWDMQTEDALRPVLVHNEITHNNSAFSKILSLEKSSTPKVYMRKKSNSLMDCGSVMSISPQCDKMNSESVDTVNEKKPLNFTKFPLAESFPKKGDIIAFKMLKIGADYSPQLSDYITGKVVSACKDTHQLHLVLLDGSEQLQQPQGKFDLDDTASHVATDLQVNWNELIETRLIHP